MRIPIRRGEPSNHASPFPPQFAKLGSEEVVLIELQGSLEVEGDQAGEIIGILKMEKPDKPELQIGHHLLEGKVASLSKPLAVLRTVRTLSETEYEGDEQKQITEAFEIVSIVKKKIVFSKRPRPLVKALPTR